MGNRPPLHCDVEDVGLEGTGALDLAYVDGMLTLMPTPVGTVDQPAMADDPAVRYNRIALLESITRAFARIASIDAISPASSFIREVILEKKSSIWTPCLWLGARNLLRPPTIAEARLPTPWCGLTHPSWCGASSPDVRLSW